MPRHSEEEQGHFRDALQRVADEEQLSNDQLDALNVLESADLERFREVWSALPAGARERLVRALRDAADTRLRLDFSPVNYLGLDDPDAAVRLAAVECALEDQSSRLLERLLTLMRHDPDGTVRLAATEDLGRYALLAELGSLDAASAARIRQTLLEAVSDASLEPVIRNAALAGLGYYSDNVVADLLGSSFTDPTLRLGAIRGMGRNADPRWTDRLMPVLGSEDADQREEAARALGEIQDERAAGPLTEVIEDPDPAVRLAVIAALGEIGGDEAREALLYAMEDPDERIRAAADSAISALEAVEEDPLDL